MPSLDRIKLTQNGEAAAVLMDAHEYDKLQRTLTMLQIMKISEEQYRRGEGQPIESAKKRIENKRAALRK